MPMTSKQMIKLLKSNGFRPKSQEGSHLKMYNKDKKIMVIVPMHSRDLKPMTERAILKRAQIEGGRK